VDPVIVCQRCQIGLIGFQVGRPWACRPRFDCDFRCYSNGNCNQTISPREHSSTYRGTGAVPRDATFRSSERSDFNYIHQTLRIDWRNASDATLSCTGDFAPARASVRREPPKEAPHARTDSHRTFGPVIRRGASRPPGRYAILRYTGHPDGLFGATVFLNPRARSEHHFAVAVIDIWPQ
jgi:hypothetical protein